MEIIKFGTLYFDDLPVGVGYQFDGTAISIGNTISESLALPWVKTNGLFVAARIFCTNISWEHLDSQKLIRGKPIWIDGKPYLCRSLKVGNEIGAPNEWDAILDAAGEDDELWHWKDTFFWGQEVPLGYTSTRAIRGCTSARTWNHDSAFSQDTDVGFRPVLEPLIPDTLISDALIGQFVKVYGPDGDITGTLIAVSDCDLFLSPSSDVTPIPDCNWCSQQEDRTIVVDRSAVVITRQA